MIMEDIKLSETEIGAEEFKKFAFLLKNIFHFKFHKKQEETKLNYQKFNPNSIGQISNSSEEDSLLLEEVNLKLLESLDSILVNANYQLLPENILQEALEEEKIFPISSLVPFDQFEYIKIYTRGEGQGTFNKKLIIPFIKKEIQFKFFSRVILIFKVKENQGLKRKIDVGIGGKIYIKFFRNIPKAALEMVFPDPKPQMKLIHKLNIFVPMLIGVGVTLKEVIIDPYLLKISEGILEKGISVELLVILAGLFGYAYKAHNGYKNTIRIFLHEISQGLYFRVVGNNEAVITSIIDEAEEQECIEILLAYYFLLKSGIPCSPSELDKKIEEWFSKSYQTVVNFDVADAIKKIVNLSIIIVNSEGIIEAKALKETLVILDREWDNYFEYNKVKK